jgi:hypothetical protein
MRIVTNAETITIAAIEFGESLWDLEVWLLVGGGSPEEVVLVPLEVTVVETIDEAWEVDTGEVSELVDMEVLLWVTESDAEVEVVAAVVAEVEKVEMEEVEMEAVETEAVEVGVVEGVIVGVAVVVEEIVGAGEVRPP